MVKVNCSTGASSDIPSQGPGGTSTAEVGTVRPSAQHSGGGENTALSRPGLASPTTPRVEGVPVGRTTCTGSVGVGLNSAVKRAAERKVPPAPEASRARPPSRVTSDSRTGATPGRSATCTESSIRSRWQVSRTVFDAHAGEAALTVTSSPCGCRRSSGRCTA